MTQTNEPLTKDERRALRDIAEGRRKLAKGRAAARRAEILAHFETTISAEYDAYDLGLREVVAAADRRINELDTEVNDAIARECDARGIPPRFRPHWYASPFGSYWRSRTENEKASRRAELRRVAERAASAEEKQAIATTDQQILDFLERLTLGRLRSYEARRLLEQMPKVEDLMPLLSVKAVERMAAALGARTPEERAQLLASTGLLALSTDPTSTAAPLPAADEEAEA